MKKHACTFDSDTSYYTHSRDKILDPSISRRIYRHAMTRTGLKRSQSHAMHSDPVIHSRKPTNNCRSFVRPVGGKATS